MFPLHSSLCGSQCQHWGPLGSSWEHPLAWLGPSLLQCLATGAGGHASTAWSVCWIGGVTVALSPGQGEPRPSCWDMGQTVLSPVLLAGLNQEGFPHRPSTGSVAPSQCGVFWGGSPLHSCPQSLCLTWLCQEHLGQGLPLGRDLSMKQKLRQNPQIKLLLRLFLSLPGLFLEARAVPAPHGGSIHGQRRVRRRRSVGRKA